MKNTSWIVAGLASIMLWPEPQGPPRWMMCAPKEN